MIKLALPIVGCAALLLVAIPAPGHVPGDGPVADLCAGCHRAHTAQGATLLTFSSETASKASRKSEAKKDLERSSGGVSVSSRGSGFAYRLIDPARAPGLTVDEAIAAGFVANVSAWCSTCSTPGGSTK